MGHASRNRPTRFYPGTFLPGSEMTPSGMFLLFILQILILFLIVWADIPGYLVFDILGVVICTESNCLLGIEILFFE